MTLPPSLRLATITVLLSLAAAVLPARAATAAQAEQFVQSNVQHGLAILTDQKLPEAQRREEFRQFLLKLADIRRTALFTLGAGRRVATPSEVNAFVDAFQNYAIAIYEARLSEFSGQTLTVTGGVQRAPGDFIVETKLIAPNADSGTQPIKVDFRLEPHHGSFKVIDVGVVGVWLAIEERDQFSSFLQQHNNSVPTLTSHLEALTQQLKEHPQAAAPSGSGG